MVKLFKNPEENSEKGTQVSIYPWMPLSKDQRIPIIADWVVTMVEPVDSLKEMYEQDIVNYGNQSNSTDNDSAGSDQSD